MFSELKMPKKPFSGKAKKAQLAAKKVKQANKQLGTKFIQIKNKNIEPNKNIK